MSPHLPKENDLVPLIDRFVEYLEVERGSSPLTVRNYKHYLRRFTKWLINDNLSLDVIDINPELVRQYRVYLSRLKHNKPGKANNKTELLSKRTQSYHVIALRSFLRYLVKNDYKTMSPDKIELPRIGDRQIKFLTGTQVDRLLNSPTLATINGLRDKAILEVLYSTGLRVSELVSLDRQKIDFNSREFGIKGKGGKSRVVFLSRRASRWISKYLKRREDHYKPLFIRHKGNVDPSTPDEKMRLTPRSVQRMVKKYSRKIGLPFGATPHVLRHSFATDLLIAGADLRSVQEMLGHKNVQTTQIYTHVTNKQLKDVHEAFHAGNK